MVVPLGWTDDEPEAAECKALADELEWVHPASLASEAEAGEFLTASQPFVMLDGHGRSDGPEWAMRVGSKFKTPAELLHGRPLGAARLLVLSCDYRGKAPAAWAAVAGGTEVVGFTGNLTYKAWLGFMRVFRPPQGSLEDAVRAAWAEAARRYEGDAPVSPFSEAEVFRV